MGEKWGRPTVDRIILDAVFVLPAWASESEWSASGAVQGSHGAWAIARGLIDDETQGTGAPFRR